ncbi:TPA: hypothetical protein QB629_000312 [Pasteurella multocida]|nr:hypothetical protein [Pasteurella multocida]
MDYTIHKTGWVLFRGGPPRNYHYLPPGGYAYSAHLIGGEIWVSYFRGSCEQLLKRIPVTGVSEDDHKQIYRIAHDYLYKFDGKIHLAPNDPLYNYFRKKRLKNVQDNNPQ